MRRLWTASRYWFPRRGGAANEKAVGMGFDFSGMTFALCLPVLRAETEDEIWTLVTQEGIALTRIGTKVSVGDEYISGDNTVYRVISIDEVKREATVAPIGEEAALTQAFFLVQPVAQNAKRVGLYCTHSDESYEIGDGTSSIETGWAGIHDVAATLKSWLEDKGIEVDFDTGTFLPHDAGAYRRSRSATASLVKKGPAAIFDIHRDGIPDAAEYETQVNGEDMTMVRLLVGRSNPNSAENRAVRRAAQVRGRRALSRLGEGYFHRQGQLQSGAAARFRAAGIRHAHER